VSEASQTTEPTEAPGPGADGAERGSGLDEPPPFWSRWSRLYWFVAGLLAALTLAFWLLSRWAS
jgi:hypothetical protein